MATRACQRRRPRADRRRGLKRCRERPSRTEVWGAACPGRRLLPAWRSTQTRAGSDERRRALRVRTHSFNAATRFSSRPVRRFPTRASQHFKRTADIPSVDERYGRRLWVLLGGTLRELDEGRRYAERLAVLPDALERELGKHRPAQRAAHGGAEPPRRGPASARAARSRSQRASLSRYRCAQQRQPDLNALVASVEDASQASCCSWT